MKKLISAVTSLCMAASMVSAVVPATVGAADSTKGFSIKTYNIDTPSADNGKSTITIDKKDIPAGGYTIPSAVYYSEATDNSTGSLLASITTDSKDIKFKLYDPDKDAYSAGEKSYTLKGVDFTSDHYISFAGKASKREGYMAGGLYQMACESSQTAAKTDNYFIGCSWMNNGEDYAWAGDKSDSYPFYVFDTIIPQDIAAGTYKVMFCDYNTDATGKNDNPCPMVESQGTRFTKKEGNLKLEELTIKVTDGGTSEETTTTAPKVTTTTTAPKQNETTTTSSKPVSNADIKFDFVEYESQKATIEAKPGASIDVDVNITAGGKDVSALDVQFKGTGGIVLEDVLGSAAAFPGAKVSKNVAESRANYATLKGDTPMVPVDGKSAFGLTIKIPDNIADGTYTFGFDSQCKIFKDNTKFNYTTDFTPLTIKIGNGGSDVTTTTTTTAPKQNETTTTSVKPVGNADIKFDFVEYESQKATINAKAGASVDVDVNITAGGKDVSALDVQFKGTGGIVLEDVLGSAAAFPGAKVSKNVAESRANYATLKGDTPMVPVDGKSAFGLTIKIPADIADGTYTFGFDSQCKVFKDNTKFNYTTDFTPLTIVIGNGGSDVTTTTTTTATTTKPVVTSTTTTAPIQNPTTTTVPSGKTIKVTMWGDANCDGKVNVADVVAVRNMVADMDAFLADAGFAFDKAQGRVNADVVDPQDITGAACDPAKVKMTGADADHIISYIISGSYDMAKAVTPKNS